MLASTTLPGLAQSAPADPSPPAPASTTIAGVNLSLAGSNALASPGWDGTTKPRGQNGDLAVLDNANGKTAFVAGGARFHGLWSTSAGRVCTDYGGVKVVDLNNLANPPGIIDIVDTKGVLSGPTGNPRRGLFLKNISSSASAVEAMTFTAGPAAGKDVLAITTQRCEQSFFDGARIEFWDVTNRAAPTMLGVFDPQSILNPTPGGSPADGRWGIFEDVRLFSRNNGPGGTPRYFVVATSPFSIGNAGTASFAGDFRYIEVTDPANPVQLATFPETTVSSVSDNGCRTFHGGRSAAPSPDGSRSILSWYDGMQLTDANFGSANSAAVLNIDLDNVPVLSGPSTFPKSFSPTPPVWGYPIGAPGGQTASGMVEGNAAHVQPFNAAGDKLMSIVSEDDVDPGVTNFVITSPAQAANGVGQRACQIGVSKHVHELPGQQLAGEVVYVGRACPASQIANQTLPVADPLVADPNGKIAVVDGGQATFSGCDAADRVRRLAAAGATGVLFSLGGDFLSVAIPGQDGDIPSIPSVGIQLTSYNKLVNYVPNRIMTNATFPTTWTRSTTTNVVAKPYAFPVTNASNATPIVITTGTAAGGTHGLATGDRVTISGITGNTAANGNWAVTVINANSFSLDTSVGNGAWTGAGSGVLCPAATPACSFTPRRTDLARFSSLANGSDPVASGEVATASQFAVVAGQSYTATAHMEVEAYTSGTFRTAVVWYDVGNAVLGTSDIQALTAVTPRTQYTATVVAPANAVKASTRFEWTGGGAGTAFADTFAVNPASMMVSVKDHPGDCAGMGVWPPADPCPTTAKAGFGAQRIIDFSQSPPAEVGTYRSPSSLTWPPPDNGLYVPSQARLFGRDIALTAWHSDGLRVLDISNPSTPVEVASFVPAGVADPSAAAGAGPSNRAGAVGTCGGAPVACMTRGASWPTKPLITSVDVLPTGVNTATVVVSDINAGIYVLDMTVTRTVRAVANFDGDTDSDRSIFRDGGWYAEGQAPVFFGLPGDVPVPGDYDGDGDADQAIFRNGSWYINGQATVFLGLTGDIPVPGDYDGDGTTDPAVFRPSTGAWYVDGLATVFLGLSGDIPVPGDYNGDGATERAVFRNGIWYIEGQAPIFHGLTGDIPVPGDYDGNGTTDQAVFRNGAWYTNGQATVFFGLTGDVPVPADYDGNGTTDRAVFRNGSWYTDGQATAFIGLTGDVPVPLPQAIYDVFF